MSSLKCGVCYEVFNESNHKPHTTNCGHNFCTVCLTKIIKEGYLCPECKEEITNKSIDEVPVSQSLLRLRQKANIDNKGNKRRSSVCNSYGSYATAGTCDKHEGAPIYFYCSTCKKSICQICLTKDHPQPPSGSCYAMTITNAAIRIKSENAELAERFAKSANPVKLDVQAALTNLANEDSNIKSKIEIGKASLDTQTAIDCTLKDFKQKFEAFLFDITAQQNKVIKYKDMSASDEDFEITKQCDDVINAAVKAGKKLLNDCNEQISSYKKTSQKEKYALRKNLEYGFQLSRPLYYAIEIHNQKKWARVTVEQNHLMMHSFEKTPPESGATIMQYSDAVKEQDKIAFAVLDICWKNSYKGRVIIKLNKTFKRAQNFKLLCTGEKGKTYKGTKFYNVKYKNKIAEQIKGGDYEKNNGEGGGPLVSNMVDNEMQTSLRMEGIVYTTNPKKYNMQSQFGICLKEDKNQVFFGYFGSVKSGLGILKKACEHIREGVYIMDCGVLLDIL